MRALSQRTTWWGRNHGLLLLLSVASELPWTRAILPGERKNEKAHLRHFSAFLDSGCYLFSCAANLPIRGGPAHGTRHVEGLRVPIDVSFWDNRRALYEYPVVYFDVGVADRGSKRAKDARHATESSPFPQCPRHAKPISDP